MTEDLLTKATEPFHQHDACHECGKRTDGLMLCTYSHDNSIVKLCPDCIEDSGFCIGCGHFCVGMSSFDFSDVKGYCSDCVDDMKDAIGEFEDNYDDL